MKSVVFKKIINKFFFSVLLVVGLNLTGISSFAANHASIDKQKPNEFKTIAITQITGHNSLNDVYRGIIDELKANGYEDKKTAHIMFSNAQGSVVVASQIAQQFVATNPDVIVAIATPSAQAVISAAKKTTIPIVFAAVSDPIGAKLVNNLEHPGGNITGTMNVSPIDEQIAFVRKMNPDIKTLGVLVNFGEANSVTLLRLVEESAKKHNIKIKTAQASSSAEVQSAAQNLVSDVDAFFLLQDNTVASALPVVLKTSLKYKTPVYATYISAVENGALAGLAFDDYKIGRQTGKQVVKILRGEKPGNIPVEDAHNLESAINLDTAKKLNITISQEQLKEFEHKYPAKNL